MFIDKLGFQVRTSSETLSFQSGDGFMAKCSNFFFEMKANEQAENEQIEIIGAFFYPSVLKAELKGIMGFLMKPMMKMNFTKMADRVTSDYKYYVENAKPSPQKLKTLS